MLSNDSMTLKLSTLNLISSMLVDVPYRHNTRTSKYPCSLGFAQALIKH